MTNFSSTRAPRRALKFQKVQLGDKIYEFPANMKKKEIAEILNKEFEKQEAARVGGREQAKTRNTVFEAAIAEVLKNEGGYVNDPDDPGGETKFGITKKTYPELDIFNLTEEEAIAIYRRDFWDANRYGDLSPALAGKMLDMSINLGSPRANKILQTVVGSKTDGIVGPKTLKAAEKLEEEKAISDITKKLKTFYKDISTKNPNLRKYLKGWSIRADKLPIPLEAEFIGLDIETPALPETTPEGLSREELRSEQLSLVEIPETSEEEKARQGALRERLGIGEFNKVAPMEPGFFQREDGTFFELTPDLEMIEHGA